MASDRAAADWVAELSTRYRDATGKQLPLTQALAAVPDAASAEAVLSRYAWSPRPTPRSLEDLTRWHGDALSVRRARDEQLAAGPDGLTLVQRVSQMKGGISIDPLTGCPLGCAYCYRREGETGEAYVQRWRPEQSVPAEEAVRRLVEHPWFVPHMSPLGVHMSTTEAFLPQVWPSTVAVLAALDALGFTNQVSLITKRGVSEEQAAFLGSLDHLDVDVAVCWSGLPESIEPSPSSLRLAGLRNVASTPGVHAIGYLRPIIPGYNDSSNVLRRVLHELLEQGPGAVAYGGVKFSDEHREQFILADLQLPAAAFAPGKKSLGPTGEDTVLAVHRELVESSDAPLAPIFRRASCARSYVRGLRDYNAHWRLAEVNCQTCPSAQRARCYSAPAPSPDVVAHLVERVGVASTWRVDDHAVVVGDAVTMFEIAALRQVLRFPVIRESDHLDDLLADRVAQRADWLAAFREGDSVPLPTGA